MPASEVLEICENVGHRFRDRVYTPVVTLWMFLGQTLSPDHSCRDAVHRLNAWRVKHGKTKVDSNTTAYCEARLRLPEKVFQELSQRSATKCSQNAAGRWQWKGHDVKVVDGFTLTMPDTRENQREYPQQRGQKKGCGFPMMRCVMLFCLATGAALDLAMGPYRGKQTGENSLIQAINNLLFPGEILLADRYYATFGNIVQAIKGGYHVVMRSHHKRKIDFRRGFKQGSYDQIVTYEKPTCRPVWMSKQEYRECPAFILVRHVSYQVKRKGFRARRIILATTMLDANAYSVDDLADLYCRRWQVELDIRSLKTHMQMEHLRCKSPAMVRKEIYAHMIAYNLIRDLIVRTSIIYDVSPKSLSHKGTVQALNAFAQSLHAGSDRINALEAALYESIMEHPIGDRKPRIHPREIKRRPKSYKLMQKPRHAARRSAA
ncbi:IS4 family transposase [Stieleria sedimenti]|uniref:IS4 family transposase n=1 Tax=Stieleria sedimenti TaxID=2976331 RepID=UPI00217F6A33|nr:IS4 family transposase [Stieleria sedimenti]